MSGSHSTHHTAGDRVTAPSALSKEEESQIRWIALVRCPRCHLVGLEAQLANHASKCSRNKGAVRDTVGKKKRVMSLGAGGRRPPEHKLVATRRFKGQTASTSDRHEHEDPRIERQHDATKDYWNSFREGGRFGSHASHDSYDDEAQP